MVGGVVERELRQEGIINHINTDLEFSQNTTTQHLIYRIKIQWIYIQINLKQIRRIHLICESQVKGRNNRNLSPVQCTTNINVSTQVLNRELFLSAETESWKRKEEITGEQICESHCKISWLRGKKKKKVQSFHAVVLIVRRRWIITPWLQERSSRAPLL